MTYTDAVAQAKTDSWDKKKTLYVVATGAGAKIVTPAQYRKTYAGQPYTHVYGNFTKLVTAD